MFGKSSKNRIFDINDDSGMVVTVASSGSEIATNVSRKKQEPARFVAKKKSETRGETASGYATSNSGNSAGRPSNTSSEIVTFALQETVLETLNLDISNETNKATRSSINKHYRDMYYHDSVCGTVVSLLSQLPFSDFTIIGDNNKQTQDYNEAVEAISGKSILPSVTTEYNVVGAFLASLDWDNNDKKFKGILPHSIDFAELSPPAYFGKDPKITLEIPPHIRAMVSDKKDNNTIASIFNTENKSVELPEHETIFIPRSGMLRDYFGVSYFRRALLPWLIEKAFIRGMIDQSYKRQRPITHITMGDGGEWTPSPEEMAAVVQLFIDADLDPVASYVVTRSGININEVRNGGDYFKWSDVYDNLTTIKLKALGVSDAFLSSEANYATMEQTLSVFMEQMRAYRLMIQREMFEDRVFTRIAKTKRYFRKASKGETAESIEIAEKSIIELADDNYSLTPAERSRLALPSIQWVKRLLPESDDAYIQMLGTLEEKGVPIPIRIWAAAGGFSIENLLEAKQSDLELREKVSDWNKEKKKLNPSPDEGGGEEASYGSIIKPIPFANRTFNDEQSEKIRDVINLDSNGRRRVTTAKGRAILNEKKHKIVAEAAANLAKNINAQIKNERPVNKGFFVMPSLLDEDE